MFVSDIYGYIFTPAIKFTTDMKMKLSKIAILALKGSDTAKAAIADVLGVTITSVYRWISDNDDNLTKAAVIEIIKKETGLPETQILEFESVTT